jgi:hypothetical protein
MVKLPNVHLQAVLLTLWLAQSENRPGLAWLDGQEPLLIPSTRFRDL